MPAMWLVRSKKNTQIIPKKQTLLPKNAFTVGDVGASTVNQFTGVTLPETNRTSPSMFQQVI